MHSNKPAINQRNLHGENVPNHPPYNTQGHSHGHSYPKTFFPPSVQVTQQGTSNTHQHGHGNDRNLPPHVIKDDTPPTPYGHSHR